MINKKKQRYRKQKTYYLIPQKIVLIKNWKLFLSKFKEADMLILNRSSNFFVYFLFDRYICVFYNLKFEKIMDKEISELKEALEYQVDIVLRLEDERLLL